MAFIKSKIIGSGSYLPEKVLTNFDLEKIVDTTDDWIQERTGIKSRHAVETENTSDLAFYAAKKAIADAGLTKDDIDLVIVATTTPDNTFPATAAKVQGMLEINKGAAFDIQAVCSGFVYALSVADGLIKTGNYKNALVIGAETLTKLIDWTDRNTCVLFGDGAGAVVLQGYEATDNIKDKGIIDNLIRADGSKYDLLVTTGGLSSEEKNLGYITMQGRDVYKHAVANLTDVAEQILEKNGISKDELALFVPHQANIRIIESTAKKLNFTLEKTIVTLYHHGNTSAASIPLALDYARQNNKIKENDLVLLDAMGGGFTWGASLIRF